MEYSHEAFSSRDPQWEQIETVTERYRASIIAINDIIRSGPSGELQRGRLKNQADFYSLVGAIDELLKKGSIIDFTIVSARFRQFIGIVEDEDRRVAFEPANRYYAATRSASNDPGPRQTRIGTITGVITGTTQLP